MNRTYPEVLGDWVMQGRASRPDKNLVAFLAVREEVRAAVEAGYSIAAIWKNMRADRRIVASYDTFRRHVNRYLHPITECTSVAPLPNAANKVIPISTQATTRLPEIVSISKTTFSDGIPSFTFDPKPNLEDLI